MNHVALLFALFALASCAGAPQVHTSPGKPAAPATLQSLVPEIDAAFRKWQQEAHVSGLVWGVVKDGALVHYGGSGVQDRESARPVNADSLFRIASMSKAFTALAILQLRDAGKVSLDAPAETYVPELKGWTYPTDDAPRIRVRDLLSHVGGLVTDDPWGDRQQPLPEADFTAMLRAGVSFSRAPQTAFEYSNFGYALLGRIITNVTGRPFDDYIRVEIMVPLGMASTGYEVSNAPIERRALGYRWENEQHALEPAMGRGVFGAMGGVQTSVKDYARWVAFLLNAWPARSGAEQGPVRRSSVRELAQGLNFPRVLQREGSGGAKPCAFAVTYGMGMNARTDCELGFALSHAGGYPGYGAYVLLMPDSGLGVFAFANGTYAVPGQPVTLAALALQRAGLVPVRPLAVSAALDQAYQIAARMYAAGNLEPGKAVLAMNFLFDRSADRWVREFGKLKQEVGQCDGGAPIHPTGMLSGDFRWTCERGAIEGELLLSPTNPPGIQALRLKAVPSH
ncbi:MAG: beta-lactamase family protein [Burkholderiales bacterium]|nr:beta-lactamase family protein [Burkholderiales bacterium]